MWKNRSKPFLWLLALVGFVTAGSTGAQTLNLPPRPADALTGTQFTNLISSLSLDERENRIYEQIVSGNVPEWLRALKPISVTFGGHTATYYVTPDYLAVGSDTNYQLQPMTPLLAQRLGDRLGYTLPTRQMVNQIWTNAALKLIPISIPASAQMTTVPVFARHNQLLWDQRRTNLVHHPLGTLLAGNKKDVVISSRIYTNFANAIRKPVVIYGWHKTSGAPIQPLYNGHEETYADYSHGIRFVQQTMLVDGAANTVTNVLRTPALARLLSDEVPAEGASVNGEIALPRYTITNALPVPRILLQPRSQSVYSGSDLMLRCEATGNGPLTYAWRLNGLALAGATNVTLSLTNLNAAQAGQYTVAVADAVGEAVSRVAVVRVRTNAFPILFEDPFETDTATNWTLSWAAANNVPDYAAQWAFNYGTTTNTFNGVDGLIPAAPNSPDGSTRGLRLAVNVNDATAATAAVNLFPKDQSFSGNFALKFDLWIQYPGDAGGTGTGVAGSTQHALFGLNHSGTNVNWNAPVTTPTDGWWFGVTGEGGDSKDFRAYLGNLAGPPVEFVASDNTAAVYQTLFPASRFETAGAPGKNWVEVEVRQTNNVVFWLLNDTLIAQRSNPSGQFTNGTVMLGLMDVFASIASPIKDSFVLFDNVRVEDLSPTIPLQLKHVGWLPDGGILLAISGASGDRYWVDASTNLVHWEQITFLPATNYFFAGSPTSEFPTRYYRARR